MDKKLSLESSQNRWVKLARTGQKNEAVEIAKLIRFRARLRRHLANPNVFPKPVAI